MIRINYCDTGELVDCTTTPRCEHKRGWYYKLRIGLMLSKKVFVCEDCMEILDDKRKEVLR